jgi:hypothetical protein
MLMDNLSIIKLEEFYNKEINIDFFICCSSFEERCVRSSEICKSKNIFNINTSLIFNYRETDPAGKKIFYLKKIEKNLKKISKNVIIFDSDSVSLPSEGLKKFIKFLKDNNIDCSSKKIAIDISVFTKPYFFLLLKILKEQYNNYEFIIIYTEPEEYKHREKNRNEIILTEGLDRVETIPGFFGSSIRTKDVLIVSLGYEGKRALQVFRTVNPETTYAINGFPSYQPGWHNVSMEANLRFLYESRSYEHYFYAPADDPFYTKLVLLKIIKEIKRINKNLNIIISPLGTKPQAFGALLLTFKVPNVKIIYPFPSTYSPDYSYKYGPTKLFKIDLNKI